ncbi:MAG: NAD-dependent epimerase/dehydratase family protein [Acidimicrobiales bacterium]|jgi:UDP-glucose 4-epimerase
MLTEPLSWVVGRGGLLGGGVESALAARGPIWHPRSGFDWQDPDEVATQLTAACHDFADEVGDAPWQVAWCAGAGVVGSEASELERETQALGHLLEALSDALGPDRGAAGAMFLASSAGGVYAGSPDPPFREDSPVRPLAPYGENKLRQESLAREWSNRTGTPVLIGRISNLYGPGQHISKSQGLITMVCRRVMLRQPLMLYVPLDTIRDYCYITDASRLVAGGLERLRREANQRPVPAPAPVVVKIIASQQPATIGTVLAQVRWVTKRPVSVIIAVSPNARRQAPDLRMISTVWPELNRHPTTTLSAGLRAVVNDLLFMAERGLLSKGTSGGP